MLDRLIVSGCRTTVQHLAAIPGKKVTMYAEWRNSEDYEAMRADLTPLPYFQEALTFARFEPGMYEVVRTFSPSAR